MTIRTILVVDDSPTERHALSALLTRAGYQVLTAASGDEAIARCRTHPPDLVLMDVVMPGTNGFQATRALARDEQTRGIPVIICTTKSMKTDQIWGMRQGAVDYVTKPVDAQRLLEKISLLAALKS
jgi:twitching motility two-component system response regulator PilH